MFVCGNGVCVNFSQTLYFAKKWDEEITFQILDSHQDFVFADEKVKDFAWKLIIDGWARDAAIVDFDEEV